MDWLSDFGWWLLNFAATAADWLFAVSVIFIVVAAVTLIWLIIGVKGNVSMGPDPEPRKPLALPPGPGIQVHSWQVPEPNYYREFVEAIDEATDATVDLTDAMEATAEFTPIVVTPEIEVYEDPKSAPIYYRLRPPPPLHLESFTTGWNRAEMLERIKEAAP